MSKEKDIKKGIQISLDAIKKLQRYELEWDWLTKDSDGAYIEIEDVKNKLIELLSKGFNE